MLVNKRKLAEILGRSERTLTTWIKQGMPVEISSTRGRAHQFDTAEVVSWMIQREISTLSDGGNLDLTVETARLKHYQANNEALKEAQLRGSLIPAELIIEFGSAMVGAARAKLLAIHSKIRNRFSDLSQDVIDEIQEFHHEALEELGNDGVPGEIRERIQHHIDHLETTSEPNDQ